ncbi:hypothetical protein MGH68_11420 [Erysipelothrix sp. D19-032]
MKIAITEMLELDAVSTKTIENLGFEIIRYPLETVYDGNADVIVGMHLPKETIPHDLKFAQLLSPGMTTSILSYIKKRAFQSLMVAACIVSQLPNIA